MNSSEVLIIAQQLKKQKEIAKSFLENQLGNDYQNTEELEAGKIEQLRGSKQVHSICGQYYIVSNYIEISILFI